MIDRSWQGWRAQERKKKSEGGVKKLRTNQRSENKKNGGKKVGGREN